MTEDNTMFEAVTGSGPELISIIAMISGDERLQLLREGKWVDGRYDKNIRIDRDSHFASVGADDLHAHVYGRRDRDNALVAVRLDGSKSHNLGGRLHRNDADTLRALGFKISKNNLVEIFALARAPSLLLNESLRLNSAI